MDVMTGSMPAPQVSRRSREFVPAGGGKAGILSMPEELSARLIQIKAISCRRAEDHSARKIGDEDDPYHR
jgi:hypothetical protein